MSDGTLGSIKITLPHWLNPEERYQRTYRPITPASRIISGDNDAVAPETDIATWSIKDWSAGEGDIRWKDRGRYNTGTGVHLAADGSGLIPEMQWDEGGGGSAQTEVIVRGGNRVLAARDHDSNIYYWNGSSWTSLWAIGGSAGRDVCSMAAPTTSAVYVLESNSQTVRKVTSGGNSPWNIGVDYLVGLVSYEGLLYGLNSNNGNLVLIDQSTAYTTTTVYTAETPEVDTTGFTDRRWMSVSDVGPIWLSPTSDGRTLIKEYNVADDVGYVVGELPKDSWAMDLFFYSGIYFVTYRTTENFAGTGNAYLWYKRGGTVGSAGPFPNPSTTASKRIVFGGIIGDRLYMTWQEQLWAYDLSDGALIMVADFSDASLGDAWPGVVYGRKILMASETGYYLVFDTEAVEASSTTYLSSGLHDYGYLGLPKMIHTVTVQTEDVLAASHTVQPGYSIDGGTVTWLDDDFATGEASHTWQVSTVSGGGVIGTEIEWFIRVASTSSSSWPKVVAINSDVSGAASRIEWNIAIDVAASSLSGSGSDGVAKDVIAALNALKTSHAPATWSDPNQVADYDTPQSFDVRVLDVTTPELADGFTTAIVKLQTIGIVG